MNNTNIVTKDIQSDITFEENFAELFEASATEGKREGSVIEGKIISIDNDSVVIDVGLKSEGRVPLREFTNAQGELEAKIGDIVEVYLERLENASGQAILSKEKAYRQKAWSNLEQNFKDGDNIEGVIFGRVKGGFTVDIQGVIAFLPGSQVDIRPVKDVTPLMNIPQPFQILKMDTRQGNVVVSRRAILEESRAVERNEMLAKIKEGDVLSGAVKNITDYGAFIDLGSVDGLLHVTDISWTRVSHPSELLSIGQKLDVKVIKYNQETKRISLGLKQLNENPWADIHANFPQGSKHKGKVTNVTDYGAFVEITKGIEGLVHVSEISWEKATVDPKEHVKSGEEIEVMVLDIDTDKQRVSLGIKQCMDHPANALTEQYPIGTILEKPIKQVEADQFIVAMDDNIEAVLPFTELVWQGDKEEAAKGYKEEQVVKIKVLGLNRDKERLLVSVKQLEENPAEKALSSLKRGSQVTCVVSKVSDEGIEVLVSDAIKGFIKRNELASERIEQRPDRFAVGDKVDARVTSINKSNKALSLSIKELEVAEQKKAIAAYGSTDSGASLGDILGAALNSSAEKK